MEPMGEHKSAFPHVSAMVLGDPVPARAGSPLQVLHRLRGFRAALHGAHLSRAHDYVLRVRML